MSQILLPPSSQEPQPPEVAASQPDASPPPSYTPEPLKQPSRFWRVVKWPIRQVLKGIYLLGSVVNRHRTMRWIALLVIVATAVGGVLTYRALNTGQGKLSGNTPSTSGSATIPDTPFTIANGAQIPPSNGVLLWLHGTKTYNAGEIWNSMSQQYQDAIQQAGNTQSGLQETLNGWRDQGLKFDEFIIAGSFAFPDGSIAYTVEAVIHEDQQRGILTWYFKTDPSGQVFSFRDLTQT